MILICFGEKYVSKRQEMIFGHVSHVGSDSYGIVKRPGAWFGAGKIRSPLAGAVKIHEFSSVVLHCGFGAEKAARQTNGKLRQMAVAEKRADAGVAV